MSLQYLFMRDLLSIPLALDWGVRHGQIKRGQKLLLEGVGGGMAWGACLLTY